MHIHKQTDIQIIPWPVHQVPLSKCSDGQTTRTSMMKRINSNSTFSANYKYETVLQNEYITVCVTRKKLNNKRDATVTDKAKYHSL